MASHATSDVSRAGTPIGSVSELGPGDPAQIRLPRVVLDPHRRYASVHNTAVMPSSRAMPLSASATGTYPHARASRNAMTVSRAELTASSSREVRLPALAQIPSLPLSATLVLDRFI